MKGACPLETILPGASIRLQFLVPERIRAKLWRRVTNPAADEPAFVV
jgi:hypothetical protein